MAAAREVVPRDPPLHRAVLPLVRTVLRRRSSSGSRSSSRAATREARSSSSRASCGGEIAWAGYAFALVTDMYPPFRLVGLEARPAGGRPRRARAWPPGPRSASRRRPPAGSSTSASQRSTTLGRKPVALGADDEHGRPGEIESPRAASRRPGRGRSGARPPAGRRRPRSARGTPPPSTRARPWPRAGPSSRARARATPARARRRPGRRCRRCLGRSPGADGLRVKHWHLAPMFHGWGGPRSRRCTPRGPGGRASPTSARSRSSTSCTGPPRVSRWTSASSGGREAATNVSTGRIPAASASSTMSSPSARNWPSSRRRRVACSLRRVLQALVLA